MYLKEEYIFLLSLLIFWISIYILSKLVLLNKYGLQVKPLFIRYSSETFKRILYRYSGKWKKMWKMFSYMSVLLGLGLTFFAMIFLLLNLMKIFFWGGQRAIIAPIIPGVTLSLYWLPYFLIAVVIAIFIHEMAHGILALREGVNIKAAGALLLAIFPGGFVEIDEEELNRLPHVSRMKIFSAGASSNMLAGLIVFLLFSCLFIQNPSGIIVLEVLEGGPLNRAGIGRWDVICALNGTPIRTYQDLTFFMSNVKPHDKLVVSTSKGNITIVAAPSPDDPHRAIIGIVSPLLIYYPSRLRLGFFWDIQLYLILNWLLLVFVNVAVFNMLPIPLLDGDKFIQCLLEKITVKGEVLRKILNTFSIFLIATNMLLSFT